jgi:DNA polymerase-1
MACCPRRLANVTKPKLLLLDGHSMAYRAFYALPVENFMTSTGQPTNAVYGFMSMMLNVVQAEKPTHVAVAFDVSRKTFRSEIFADYKAQRASSPPEFAGQVDLIREVLDALDIRTIALEGFEADDVIATLADQASQGDVSTAIVTGDRDAFQLVNERVTVLYPKKGVSELARMTPESISDRYGVRPDQYADYAALRGDPSDNLPGVPGVGEKTAAKWIAQYGNLAELAAHDQELKGKVGEAFRIHLPQVMVNRSLTQLRSDAPVGVAWSECQWTGGDTDRINQIMDALQFQALRDRLAAIRPGDDEVKQETRQASRAEWRDISVGDLVPMLAHHTWYVSVAGQVARGRGTIDALAFTQDGSEVLIIEPSSKDWSGPLGTWFADPESHKVLHGSKATALSILSLGGVLRGVSFDTALAAYLAQPGQRSYALADVASRVLGLELNEPEAQGQLTLDSEVQRGVLAAESTAIRDLAVTLADQLRSAEALDLLHEIEIPTSLALAEMEFLGIALDIGELESLSTELSRDIHEAETQAHAIVGHSFNLGSPKQLQQILFEDRGLPKTKKIKTGFTTDADALQGLFATTGDPLLEQLLVYRDRIKLRQTVDGLLPLADSENRIHTTFHQTAAATGRLSSSDPNLQNIPVRTATGRRIRSCFIAGENAASLMTADYSQIEMRIMAHASGDEGLIEAFNTGEDLHTTVGASVFGVTRVNVTPDMRRQVKAMSYGLAYGLSAFGLSQQLDIGVDEARRLMDEYFARFGKVRDYLHETVEEARRTGYTQTFLGRRRYLPDLNSDNRQRRDMAERMALNAPIQGSAADIVKIAMLRVDAGIRLRGLSSRLLLQVHDELVLQVAPNEQSDLKDVVLDAMSHAFSLSVPLEVSIGIGPTWDAAAH